MAQGTYPFWGLRNPVSAGTHFVAFLLALLGALILWRRCRGNRRRQLAMSCFGVSMIVLYAGSATYHALQLPPEELRFFQLLDQSAVYGLIAGTYTPSLYVLLRPGWHRRLLLSGVWVLAGAGIAGKWLLPSPPYGLSVSLYFAMGWMALLPALELTRAVGMWGILWALWGGIFYTVGGVVDLVRWPVFYLGVFGPHELFHVFVMGGTFCHFHFTARHVIPYPPHNPHRRDTGIIMHPSDSLSAGSPK
jgi:hemolysin III